MSCVVPFLLIITILLVSQVISLRVPTRQGSNTVLSKQRTGFPLYATAKSTSSPSTSLDRLLDNLSKKDNKLQFNLGKFAFSLIPLSPESVGRRKTLLTEVVKGNMWTLEQIQGIINVNVPVRCTVIKLKDGGLFVNNPVAPTGEMIDMMRALEKEHGQVKYITLSSLAVEHKGTAGAFSSYFPQASVYVQPGQYSFPLNLPTQLFFPPDKSVKEIPANFKDAPWGKEIEHAILTIKPSALGGYAETALFHKSTGTLLVTDAIVRVDDEPPAIINDDPRSLLYHARDDALQEVKDTPEARRKGWRRMTLFALTFNPSGISVSAWSDAIKQTYEVKPTMRKLGDGAVPFSGGFYPWKWVESEVPNFKALQGGLLVAPILQKLLLNRDPETVLAWADTVSKWPIKRIIPCHFANDIKATGSDFRKAFGFLEEAPKVVKTRSATSPFTLPFNFSLKKTKESTVGAAAGSSSSPVAAIYGPNPLEGDLKLLNDASQLLTKLGVLGPPAKLVSSSRRK